MEQTFADKMTSRVQPTNYHPLKEVKEQTEATGPRGLAYLYKNPAKPRSNADSRGQWTSPPLTTTVAQHVSLLIILLAPGRILHFEAWSGCLHNGAGRSAASMYTSGHHSCIWRAWNLHLQTRWESKRSALATERQDRIKLA